MWCGDVMRDGAVMLDVSLSSVIFYVFVVW